MITCDEYGETTFIALMNAINANETIINAHSDALDTNALAISASAHITDTNNAHIASAIYNAPSGNLSSTSVQGALNELQSNIDANRQQGGAYYNSNGYDTLLFNENVLGDTSVGLGVVWLACNRVGNMATISGYLGLLGFSASIPTDASSGFEFDILNIAISEGWLTGHGNHTSYGIANIEYAGDGFDYNLAGMRCYFSATSGRLHFYSGETSGNWSGSSTLVTAITARVQFSITMRVV